jgi:site-specific recombinase XerD
MNARFGSVSLQQALDRYADWLATTRQYTARSKREYLDDVSDLVEWLETRCRVQSVHLVQRDHLRGFLAHCTARGHASSTRRRSVAAIRAFFAFLVREWMLSDSPAQFLLPPERETRPPRILTADEYRRLRVAAMESLRDRALIEPVLQTGLRLSEIARLTVNDIILPAIDRRISLPIGHVRVAGRGAKSRTVTLNLRACAALSTYLSTREETGSPALFLTKFGHGIGPRGIENIVAKYCQQAGITGASVRTLRHTMAVEMLKRGAPPAVIGKALGHESPDTIGVYIDLARDRMDKELQRHAL